VSRTERATIGQYSESILTGNLSRAAALHMLIRPNPLIFPVACTRLPVHLIILDHNHHESTIYPELGARRDGSLEPLTTPAHHQESRGA
jgi:hypothetical protein